MSQQAPQPYDITPLPDFPYEPGWWEWLVLLGVVFALLCGVYALGLIRKWSQQRQETMLLREVAHLLQSDHLSPQQAARKLSNLGKRFLTLYKPSIPWFAMSTKELSARRATTGSDLEQRMLSLLVTLEDAKYNSANLIDPHHCGTELSSLIKEISASMSTQS